MRSSKNPLCTQLREQDTRAQPIDWGEFDLRLSAHLGRGAKLGGCAAFGTLRSVVIRDAGCATFMGIRLANAAHVLSCPTIMLRP